MEDGYEPEDVQRLRVRATAGEHEAVALIMPTFFADDRRRVPMQIRVYELDAPKFASPLLACGAWPLGHAKDVPSQLACGGWTIIEPEDRS